MAYSASIPYLGFNDVYAKPVMPGGVPSSTPDWGSDSFYGGANVSGAVPFENTLADGVYYWFFEQVGNLPDETDPQLASVSPPSATAPTVAEIVAAINADATQAQARADAATAANALSPGATSTETWTVVTDSPTQLVIGKAVS